jgi:hypothetical protein
VDGIFCTINSSACEKISVGQNTAQKKGGSKHIAQKKEERIHHNQKGSTFTVCSIFVPYIDPDLSTKNVTSNFGTIFVLVFILSG